MVSFSDCLMKAKHGRIEPVTSLGQEMFLFNVGLVHLSTKKQFEMTLNSFFGLFLPTYFHSSLKLVRKSATMFVFERGSQDKTISCD